jgi:hypothetical protein
MTIAIWAEVHSLRAMKLPLHRNLALQGCSVLEMREMIRYITNYQPREERQRHLLLIIEALGEPSTISAADPDSVEARLTCLRGPLLLKHRNRILDAYDDEALREVYDAATACLSNDQTRMLLLQILDGAGTQSVAKYEASTLPDTILEDPSFTNNTTGIPTHLIAELEVDSDVPSGQDGNNACISVEQHVLSFGTGVASIPNLFKEIPHRGVIYRAASEYPEECTMLKKYIQRSS